MVSGPRGSGPGGVSTPGGSAPRGVCSGVVCSRGVSALGGVCSGGVSAPGGISQDALRQRPPLWTESQTPVKTLPWPNFVAAGNKIIRSRWTLKPDRNRR